MLVAVPFHNLEIGDEADFNNLETSITVSPIPTTRVHKDHHVTQIIEEKSASTPIDTEKPLLKDPDGEDVDVHTYRLMIGSLMYLTSSRPDIMYAGNPQHALKDKGVIDSGCSLYMTGNMSYLSDFEELNGGYVSFGRNPKGGKISRKDSLRKFDRKVDEGFLVGYSVSSKAYRVFNSRTRIIQETLHVNFLENKPNVAGSGPAWLFDIDNLTKTMNYQPITVGNQSNPCADATFDGKEPKFYEKKPESEVNVSPSSSAQSRKQDD
nr:ribonuclease H-like domain-containing protein [Tanacetum cinerariifolium]